MPAEGNDASDEREQHFQNFELLRESTGCLAVLVLGGSKFMGKALVEDLLSQQVRVCTVTRGRKHWGTDDPSGGRTARILADRNDIEIFAQRLEEATKCLGRPWDMVADFSAFDANDISASLKGLGSQFKLYVYISSDSIYEVSAWASESWKARPADCVTEDVGVRPADKDQQRKLNGKDSYGHEKLEGEEVLEKGLPAGCRCVSLRLPDVVGPFDGTLRLWAYWHWLRAGEQGAPPPQVLSYKRKAKRARTENSHGGNRELEVEVPPNPLLSFVYSRDVARFMVSLLMAPSPPSAAPSYDAVNLGCLEQVPLSELLCRLSAASGLQVKERPRLAPSKNPKTYLPSVDRPWPLSLGRLREVYGFEPTPLDDVLKACASFFQKGCEDFPSEARRAAKKLPADSADMALKLADLHKLPPSSESS